MVRLDPGRGPGTRFERISTEGREVVYPDFSIDYLFIDTNQFDTWLPHAEETRAHSRARASVQADVLASSHRLSRPPRPRLRKPALGPSA